MELNRNQYFFAGILILLIGLQLRAVSTYELNAEATKLLAEKTPTTASATPAAIGFDGASQPAVLPTSRKVIQPPNWLGWCLISVGAVLILHSLSMRKPE